MRKRKGRLRSLRARRAAKRLPVGDECRDPQFGKDCEQISRRYPLADGHIMIVRRVYRRETTDLLYFAVNQSVRIDDNWVTVARIDCSHLTVHRHQFFKHRDQEKAVLEDLDSRHQKILIERWCKEARYIMQDEWQTNVGRWSGDTQ